MRAEQSKPKTSMANNDGYLSDSSTAGYDIGDYQTDTIVSRHHRPIKETAPLLTDAVTDNKKKNTQKKLSANNTIDVAKSNNIFVLWVTIICVSVVTCALAVAAVLSRSLALTADVVQNAVDISTYIVNLYAEYQAEIMRSKGIAEARGKRLELAAASFSVLGLVAVGSWVLWAALDRFHSASLPGNGGAPAHIDAHILLAFTVFGCVADLFVATIFCKYSKPSVELVDKGPLLDLEGTPEEQRQAQQQRRAQRPEVEKNVNMISAGAHVMTDAIRSITIVIGAFLIYLQHHKVIHLPVQEEVMDGVLSCFVVGCMSIAVLFVSMEIYHMVKEQSQDSGSVSRFICRPDSIHKTKREAYDDVSPSVVGDSI
jgi:Co/Zn/Cd efflux system component